TAAGSAAVRTRHGENGAGGVAVGNPALCSIQDPGVAVFHRLGRESGGVGSSVRLRQSKGAQYLTARHLLQKSILLLLRAVTKDHLRWKRVMDAHEDGDRRVSGGDFLERDEISARIGAKSVVLLRQHHAEESQLAELGNERRLEIG